MRRTAARGRKEGRGPGAVPGCPSLSACPRGMILPGDCAPPRAIRPPRRPTSVPPRADGHAERVRSHTEAAVGGETHRHRMSYPRGTFVRMPAGIRRRGGETREDHADATAHTHVTRREPPHRPTGRNGCRPAPAIGRRAQGGRRARRAGRSTARVEAAAASARARRGAVAPAGRRPGPRAVAGGRRRCRPATPPTRSTAPWPTPSSPPWPRRGSGAGNRPTCTGPSPAPTGGRRPACRCGRWPPRWRATRGRPCRLRWRQQLDALGADVSPGAAGAPWAVPWPGPATASAEPGVARVQAVSVAVATLAHVRGLPRLPKLGPAPGEAGAVGGPPAPARRRGAAQGDVAAGQGRVDHVPRRGRGAHGQGPGADRPATPSTRPTSTPGGATRPPGSVGGGWA